MPGIPTLDSQNGDSVVKFLLSIFLSGALFDLESAKHIIMECGHLLITSFCCNYGELVISIVFGYILQ